MKAAYQTHQCKTCAFIDEWSSFPFGEGCPLHDFNLLNPNDIYFITECIGCNSYRIKHHEDSDCDTITNTRPRKV